MNDMKDSRSYELRTLDAMNNLGHWVIRMILGRGEKVPNVMNNSRLGMTETTQGHELSFLMI